MIKSLILCFMSVCAVNALAQGREQKSGLSFSHSHGLPSKLAGAFAGSSGGDILIAGGTFEQDGQTVYNDKIFILPKGSQDWTVADHNGIHLAFGAAVSANNGLLCFGGIGENGVSSRVFKIARSSGVLNVTELPSLPEARAYSSAACSGTVIYLAGGTDAHGSLKNNFWTLDLAGNSGWVDLDTWPGPPRALPVTAFQNGNLYLIGGVEFSNGKPANYFKDAYKYSLQHGWSKLSEVPAWLCAENTAVPFGHSTILFINQTQGGYAALVGYNAILDTWVELSKLDFSSGIIIADPGIEAFSLLVTDEQQNSKILTATVRKTKAALAIADYVVMAAYFMVLPLVGWYFRRRQKNAANFFMGQKQTPWWAAGLSLFAAGCSAFSLMAMPARAYTYDWKYFLAHLILILFVPFSILVVIPLIRRLNVSSAFEFLERRFDSRVRLIGAFFYVLMQIAMRMGVVVLLPAIAIASITNISITTSVLLMGVICIVYTALGGIEAVIWVNVLQAVVVISAVVISLTTAVYKLGMPYEEIRSVLGQYDKLAIADWSFDFTSTTVWVLLLNTAMVVLVQTGDQGFVQRVQVTPNLKQAQKVLLTQLAIAIPLNAVLFALGTILFLFYKSHPASMDIGMKNDGIIPFFIAQQIPTGISGLVLLGIFAASMSAFSSSLNATSSILMSDFYRRLSPGASDARCLILGRAMVITLGLLGIIIAMVIAMYNIRSIYNLNIILAGLILSGTGGMYLLGLFTTRANSFGVICGVIVGTSLTVLTSLYTSINPWLYNVIGTLACFVTGYMVSVLFPRQQKDISGLTIYTLNKHVVLPASLEAAQEANVK